MKRMNSGPQALKTEWLNELLVKNRFQWKTQCVPCILRLPNIAQVHRTAISPSELDLQRLDGRKGMVHYARSSVYLYRSEGYACLQSQIKHSGFLPVEAETSTTPVKALLSEDSQRKKTENTGQETDNVDRYLLVFWISRHLGRLWHVFWIPLKPSKIISFLFHPTDVAAASLTFPISLRIDFLLVLPMRTSMIETKIPCVPSKTLSPYRISHATNLAR